MQHAPLYLDKAMPEAWKSAEAFSAAVSAGAAERGLSRWEIELINVRASQINGCAFCLDLHARLARQAGGTQQKLDMLSAWRETAVFDEREKAFLAVAEAVTHMPESEESRADLAAVRHLLGDDAFAAAEWVAVSMNMFNRISILSEHPVRPRDNEGRLIK